MSLLDEHTIFLMTAAAALHVSRRKRRHRYWMRAIIRNCQTYGTYNHLVRELELNDEEFRTYFRLNRHQFGKVLSVVEEQLTRRSTSRQSISAKERLAICLRFLATGETYTSLAYSYRVGQSTISNIVPEVCRVLWETLSPTYIKMPSSAEDWLVIAEDYQAKWQFPHCLGAIDGKYIVIWSPYNSGSQYFNYKGTFSIVLMALVDAHLQFVMIDIGSYGKNSDGGIFSHSNFGKALVSDNLPLPPATTLPGAEDLGPMPYVIIGDEAFPLQEHMMRPYAGRGCTEEQRIFNYRLSRARRCVESAFGVLAARWRVFFTKIGVSPETTKDIVKASIVLHNLLQRQTTATQTTTILQDFNEERVEGIRPLSRVGSRGSEKAACIRDKFRDYLLTQMCCHGKKVGSVKDILVILKNRQNIFIYP